MSYPHSYGSITSPPAVDFSGSSNSSEFNSYADNVVTNIYTINSSIKTLDNALKVIGTKKDNQGVRNQIHVTQLSTNQIASATSRNIHKMKLIVAKGDKHKLLQVEKLEGNFKDTVGRYYKLQKEVANKQKSHLLLQEYVTSENASGEDLEQERQAQKTREMAFEQDMLLERESRIRQIESDILDVNQIMRELGSLVHVQGETIDSIENSIDHAVGNIEEGTEQLIKASRYQSRYRRKLVYLVLIGLVIAAILIGILVSEFKK
ncbi:syntaxin 13 [Leptinotarsa decemlineata]|uniref:syntaxin 13 n=1 Tax=Leptinotarsa decemlineata TaxID=7539 RepID=UPI000C252DC9|nr:syntaxin-12 [Leptinotarsa decemlineata]